MADDYGDDDFEDYEGAAQRAALWLQTRNVRPSHIHTSLLCVADEFEEDDAAEAEQTPVSGIQQALQQEDEAVRARLKQAGVAPATQHLVPAVSADPSPPVARKHLIAPPTAQSRQLSEQKAARLDALQQVLQLRSVDMLLYDAPPLTAYELHTRHQSRHLRAKMTQTHDDDIAVGVQTEPIEAEEQDCQVPDDLGTAGRNTALTASASAQTSSLLSANVARLNRFLRSAGQLMETLCAENVRSAVSGFSSATALPGVSMRSAALRLPAALGDRELLDVSFASEGDALLAAYGADGVVEGASKATKPVRRLATGGLLCVWRLQQTEAPWQLLRCVGLPSCCLLPRKSYLALGGTLEGGVQLWDLREPSSQHATADVAGEAVALRAPTFCSDAGTGNHTSPVVALCELPTADGADDLSVASLEQHGTVILWMLVEVADNETDATDYGQAVGGRVRLFRSGSVPLCGGNYDASATEEEAARRRQTLLPTRALCLHFCPTEPSRFLVGCDTGRVLHGSRYSGATSASRPKPAAFELDYATAAQKALKAGVGTKGDTTGAVVEGAAGAIVHDIAFCPAAGLQAYFAVARSDGSLCLYHLDDGRPLRRWLGFSTAALLQIEWSASRPCLLWILDADAKLHLFDLLDDDNDPIASTYVGPKAGGGPAPPGAPGGGAAAQRGPPPLGRTDGAAGRLRFALGTRPQARSAEAPSMVAITCNSAASAEEMEACVDVHLLTDRLSREQEGEMEHLKRYLEGL